MISTVHTPLPILAETVPKVCPAFCAPSPESLTISTTCCLTVTTSFTIRPSVLRLSVVWLDEESVRTAPTRLELSVADGDICRDAVSGNLAIWRN